MSVWLADVPSSPLEGTGAGVVDDGVAFRRLLAAPHRDEIAADLRASEPVGQVHLARFQASGIQFYDETELVVVEEDGGRAENRAGEHLIPGVHQRALDEVKD